MTKKHVPHPTMRVCVGEMDAQIDVAIAPLICEMWIANIMTFSSCQGDPDERVFIGFETLRDMERFLNAVGERNLAPDALYGRIAWETAGWARYSTWWDYALSPGDFNLGYKLDSEGRRSFREYGPADICFTVSARFPRSDLAEVQRRMEAFNRRPAAEKDQASCLL